MYHIKIRKKTLEFNDVEVDEKNVHASKRPIPLNSVHINKIVAPEKFEHSDKVFHWLQRILHYNTFMYCIASNECLHKIF